MEAKTKLLSPCVLHAYVDTQTMLLFKQITLTVLTSFKQCIASAGRDTRVLEQMGVRQHNTCFNTFQFR